jgi:hypothetical protein
LNTYVHRTAPFVNNHDTFRPQLDATGNYTGWNSGQELAAHIDPRLSAAYAVAFAVDGNPHLFLRPCSTSAARASAGRTSLAPRPTSPCATTW